MPVILPDDDMLAAWLSPENTSKDYLKDLLDSIPDPKLIPRVVGPEVGNVRNNGPELVQPVA